MKDLVKFITKDQLTYLVFKPWEDDRQMKHCFTTRSGGVSTGYLESLNLGFNRGDDVANVKENYSRVCKALGTSIESVVISKQVHENNITKVTKQDAGNGIITPNKWESIDGIYTDEKGLTLVTHYADCVPLFFYAPKCGMIGMAHAGWRGTVNGIGAEMVTIWKDKEQIPLEEIEIAIGPSIGPCCFEVGPEVAEVFIDRFGKADFITFNEETGKHHIDLWACNKLVLIEAGIKEENIYCAHTCTCCNDQIFFSHRKTSGQRGTLGAFMTLLE